jgi:hypothetical protein
MCQALGLLAPDFFCIGLTVRLGILDRSGRGQAECLGSTPFQPVADDRFMGGISPPYTYGRFSQIYILIFGCTTGK